jgi:hypothetical protein
MEVEVSVFPGHLPRNTNHGLSTVIIIMIEVAFSMLSNHFWSEMDRRKKREQRCGRIKHHEGDVEITSRKDGCRHSNSQERNSKRAQERSMQDYREGVDETGVQLDCDIQFDSGRAQV